MAPTKTQEKSVELFVERLAEILLMQVETEPVVEGAPDARQDDTK